jgi:hypothetical protein
MVRAAFKEKISSKGSLSSHRFSSSGSLAMLMAMRRAPSPASESRLRRPLLSLFFSSPKQRGTQAEASQTLRLRLFLLVVAEGQQSNNTPAADCGSLAADAEGNGLKGHL